MMFTYREYAVEYYSASGKKLAEVTFPALDENTVEINHTFVGDSLRGQGVAGQLMEAAAKQLRAKKKTAKLTCSYAQKWFASHPEYQDVIR